MMNLIISLIFIASVSATPMPDFCPDTPVIKNVVKKRELCPGSRSVEVGSACVECEAGPFALLRSGV